jgi:hypothetical protein
MVLIMIHDSSVGMVMGRTVQVRFPSGASVKTGSGAHTASYPMGIGSYSPGGKAAGS